jgi:hypothetical protein
MNANELFHSMTVGVIVGLIMTSSALVFSYFTAINISSPLLVASIGAICGVVYTSINNIRK